MNVGIVGIGFMGMIHYLAYQKVRGAKVTAIATRDAKKLAGDWRGIKGNFGPPGEKMHLGPIGRYADWREMLKDPKVDTVDICLPPALHEEVAIAALAAGKHALVEKPIALETAAAERMAKKARAAGKLLMVGQVLPFFPEYAFAREAIAGGKYGKLLGGHFKRVISDPTWIKDFYDMQGTGGPVIDLHIHDAHFIRLTCGMPKAVFSAGRVQDDTVRFLTTQFVFDDPTVAVSATSGVIMQQGRSFTHAFEIYLEKATLTYDFAVVDGKPTLSTPLTVLTHDGKVKQPKLPETDAFAAELAEAAKAVKSGTPSPLLAGDLASDALKLCHKQIQSVKSGKIVKV
ncbi:MAG: Gfo/Idh/MocA family oxidoreductase [Planctomycetales bacterium]|nr:Gfo/Idh/MocA family oxidoreductase [Planctomycetales bacterium]MBN8624030.1 Gfo/Idh/MocA family oxidoreductase [Planctomycetota bacterium]